MRKKTLGLFIVLMMMCISIFGSAYAETSGIPPEIKKSVEDDFKSYIPSLEQQKTQFGLEASDDTNLATLGDGYPYYVFHSNDILKSANSIESSLKFSGYIFPITVNSKPAGIVFAEADSAGVWKVLRISSDLDFEKLYKSTIQQRQLRDAKLIYDISTHVAGIVSEQDPQFTPLRENSALTLKQGENTSFTDLKEKVINSRDEKSSNSDEANYSGQPIASEKIKSTDTFFNIPVILTLIVCVGLIMLFTLRSRKN
ncbi:hypothetical protein D3C73_544470 [compost metagenome]